MHSVTLLSAVTIGGDLIVAVGGHDGFKPLRDCCVYEVEKDRWQVMSPMRTRRMAPGVCALENEFVFAIGGHDGNERLNSAERYKIALCDESVCSCYEGIVLRKTSGYPSRRCCTAEWGAQCVS